MTTLTKTNSIHRPPWLRGLLFIPLLLACFALLPRVQAAPDPAAIPGGNTRDGAGSLASRTTGTNNSAFGTNALNKLTMGNNNAAQGNSAQFSLIDGDKNTALGVLALRLNVHGSDNTAVGYKALYNNTINNNVAVGSQALFSNTDGANNTAIGYQALFSNIHGNFNIALGIGAGSNLTGGASNIDIGSSGDAGDNGTIRIGTGGTHSATYIAGISGQATGGTGIGVFVNAAGKLGTVPSSRRFKTEIKPMDKASEAILALKPVTFRYKQEIDPEGISQFGLVAEDVKKVNPELVARDAKGEIYTVRYEAVNAMLLNEFLKEHRTVQELKSTVAQQEKDFQAKLAEQQKQIRALTTGLEKVNNQLEVSKPAPQIVGND